MLNEKKVMATVEFEPCKDCEGGEAFLADACPTCKGAGTVSLGFMYFVEVDNPKQFFACHADDAEHAIEQCHDAYPDRLVLRVFIGAEEKWL